MPQIMYALDLAELDLLLYHDQHGSLGRAVLHVAKRFPLVLLQLKTACQYANCMCSTILPWDDCQHLCVDFFYTCKTVSLRPDQSKTPALDSPALCCPVLRTSLMTSHDTPVHDHSLFTKRGASSYWGTQ